MSVYEGKTLVPRLGTVSIPGTAGPGIPGGSTGGGDVTGTRYGGSNCEVFWEKGAYSQFNIYRDGVKQNTSPNTGSSFYQGGLVSGTAYSYEVKAIQGSSEVSLGTVSIPGTAGPGIPGGGVVDVVTGTRYGNSNCEIFWDKGSYSQFNIYRDGVKQNTSANTGSSFYQNGLVGGTAYSYEVKAIQGSSEISIGSVTV